MGYRILCWCFRPHPPNLSNSINSLLACLVSEKSGIILIFAYLLVRCFPPPPYGPFQDFFFTFDFPNIVYNIPRFSLFLFYLFVFWHLPCLGFSEIPVSIGWCMALIWRNFSFIIAWDIMSISFSHSFLLVFSLHNICYFFCTFPPFLDIFLCFLFCFRIFLNLRFSDFKVSIETSWNSEIFPHLCLGF